MSEKIFGLTETGELINNETGRVYCVKGISALDLQDILNRLIKENKELKSLLKECEHELTSNTGLSAFDKCGSYTGYVEVFDNDIIDLDHSELLEKINKVDLE